MRRIVMNMKKISVILASFIFSFMTFSCQVGLGEIVDMIAPSVNVITPERTGYVLQQFTIIGTATDNLEVSSMTLQVEPIDGATKENSFFFRIKNNVWEKLDTSTDIWNTYVQEHTSIEGSKNNFRWELTFDLPGTVTSGTEYVITTQVYDNYKNESKNSKDERSVTVDMNEPQVSLISPSVKTKYNDEKSASDNYNLKDNSVLSNLLNGEFKISGSQKEDAKLDYLIVYLDDKTDTNTSDLSNVITSKKVTGDNLRNWSTTVDLSKFSGYETGKHIIRIVTESHDIAGNIETKAQGWFTYWNNADIPWVNAAFGGTSYSENITVYPSCALQGQAYDDDGIKSVKISIFKYNETTPVRVYDLTEKLADENNPTYKAWTINSLGENCSFRVEVECEDIYGNKAEPVSRYMTVTDTNPPKITIETNTKNIMTGDASGNVTLKGFVTDDGEIKSLKLVRIKSGTPSENMISYFSQNYSEWSKATTAGARDSNGNKVWNLTLGADQLIDTFHKRTFEKTFNIFTDFGINGSDEYLTTQNFIIMAEDNGNCANIDSFTWAGDTVAPSLTIDKVVVNYGNGTLKEDIDFAAYNSQGLSKKLKPFNKNNSGEITDKIVLSGRWSDNTTNVWSDKTKRGKVVLTWEGASVSITMNNDGTWISNSIVPPDSTTAALSAEFTDYAKNSVKVYENFFVSSSNPELLRISSIQNDGSYKANDKIYITLEFNKAVKFTPKNGNSSIPSLTLNVPENGTKKLIYYDSSYTVKDEKNCDIQTNGTATHVFSYTVASGEDVSALDVIGININENTWKDADDLPVLSMNLPAAENRLNKTRSLVIDTVAPTFKSIKAISAAGSYNKGKEIFLLAEFSEDVSIEDVSKIKLGLNAKTGLQTTKAEVTGPKTVLFTYQIGDGENTNALEVNSIMITGANIKDTAGNLLTSTTLPAMSGISSIIIDTTRPAAPEISGISNEAFIYESTGATFTISGFTSDVKTKKYSLDGGASWREYIGPVTVTDNGDYNLTAKQIDKAGNESEESTLIHFNIDAGHILTSVTAGVATGTYTTGNTIPLYLNFRKKLTVTNDATLSLNLANGQKATYDGISADGKKASFTYTIGEGDSCDVLNVSSITGTFTDEKGNNVSAYVISIPEGKNLKDSRTIKIVTGKPVVKSCILNEDTLTIDFGIEISKGKGNITITHGDGYRAPAVISVTDYIKFNAKEDLSDYYTAGTNGLNADGSSDLTEKYVLNYKYDTFGNSADTIALITKLKNANADKVIVPINSSFVTISGTKMTISLTETYKLPVKGASYTVSLPAELVIDKQNHKNDLETKTITNTGLENPVIRINKENEIINVSNNTVTQPLTTGVKIECQTPAISKGAGLSWEVTSQTNTKFSYTRTSGPSKKAAVNLRRDANLCSDKAGITLPLTLGDASNNTNGYIYKIEAIVSKTGETSVKAYEQAYRSVYTLTNTDRAMGDVGSTYTQLWIRGGDWTNGGLSTPDFPFSWNTSEFNLVRAMTKKANENTWYYVTWKINTNAYPMSLRGDLPADAVTKGPSVWCWGMQGPIPTGIEKYILYPGQSLEIDAQTDYAYGNMSFYNKHCEYRDGTEVIKKKKS